MANDTIDREDIDHLIKWLEQNPIPKLTKGELTRELECKWAGMLGAKHSIFVNSGSSAILLSLYSLLLSGRLKNKKIVISGLSWITDVSSALQLGFKPLLCDCNFYDLSPDLDKLELLFIRENPGSLILVSVLGLIPDMFTIKRLCNEYDVVLIEDVCESMASTYWGRNLGTFGTVSVFSTYFGHAISTIEGGFVNTDDDELSDIILSCRNHGWDRDLDKKVQDKLKIVHKIENFNQMYTFYYPGFNLRSTDLQAFIGLRQLDKLKSYTDIRFNNFKRYRERLQKVNELKILLRDDDKVSNLGFPVVSKYRDKMVDILRKSEVEIRPLIAGNIVRQPFWQDKSIDLPNCNLIHDYGFYLPNHQNLTFNDVDFICDLITK